MPPDDVTGNEQHLWLPPLWPCFGAMAGKAELLQTVPTDVATDNNICALPLHPFLGVIAGKC